MAKVVIHHNGQQLATQVKPGGRILQAAYKLGLDAEGFGDCGGNCCCSTCHVEIVNDAAFPAIKNAEATLLETVPNIKPKSRLACQLVVEPHHTLIELNWLGP